MPPSRSKSFVSSRHTKLRNWGPVVAYMALIYTLSSFSINAPAIRQLPFQDKLVHFIEYGVLGWLTIRAARGSWPAHSLWRHVGFALFLSVVWAISDELHQSLVPGRFAELADLVADSLGASAGIAIGVVTGTRWGTKV